MSHVSDIRLRALDAIQENRSWAADLASGFNIYAYAGGDPVNGADPSGMGQGDGTDHESIALGGGGNGTGNGGGCGCEGGGYGNGVGQNASADRDGTQAVFDRVVHLTGPGGGYAYSDFSNAHVAAALGFPLDPSTLNQSAQASVAVDAAEEGLPLITPVLVEGAATLGIITGTYADQILDELDRFERSSYSIKALQAAGIDPNSTEASQYDVHHIVAQYASAATLGRVVLGIVGIGINDPENLVPLLREVHQSLHTSGYYGAVNGAVAAAAPGGQPAVSGALNGIAAALLSRGHFP